MDWNIESLLVQQPLTGVTNPVRFHALHSVPGVETFVYDGAGTPINTTDLPFTVPLRLFQNEHQYREAIVEVLMTAATARGIEITTGGWPDLFLEFEQHLGAHQLPFHAVLCHPRTAYKILNRPSNIRVVVSVAMQENWLLALPDRHSLGVTMSRKSPSGIVAGVIVYAQRFLTVGSPFIPQIHEPQETKSLWQSLLEDPFGEV